MKKQIIDARIKRRALAQQMSQADNYVLLTQRHNKIKCSALNKDSLSLIAAFILEDKYANAYIMEYIKQANNLNNGQTDDNSTSASAETNKRAQDNKS